MKILALLIAVIIGMIPFLETTDRSVPSESETAAARIPLENYIQAHATGNGDFIRKASYSDAKVMAFREGKLLNLTVEEFASRFNGKPAPDEQQRKRRIDTLDLTGNAGIAKIVLDYPTATLTDYMSLLKVDGEWKIVNKVFYSEPKANCKN